MSERTKSVEGWVLVDAADGRRWLGLVSKDDSVDGKIVFLKALELWPYSTSAVVVPVMDQASVISKRQPQASLSIQNVASDACAFATPMKLPFMAPWTIYAPAGSCPATAYPKELQDVLLGIIHQIEEGCEKLLRDMNRTKPRLVDAPNGG